MNIGNALRRSYKNNPDKIAVVNFFNGSSLDFSYTYAKLFMEVNQLANGFLSLGLKKGDRLNVLSDMGLECLLCYLAAVKIGLIFTSINSGFLKDEISYIVNNSGARALVIDGGAASKKVLEIRDELQSVEYLIGIGENHGCQYDCKELMTRSDPREPSTAVGSDDLATLVYTSGTTGVPKGVPLTHANWFCTSFLFAAEQRLLPHWKWLIVLPVYTSGWLGCVTSGLIRGCTVVLSNFEPRKCLEIIQGEQINFIGGAPTIFARMVRHPNIGSFDLSSIKTWYTSAGPVSDRLMREVGKYFGESFIQPFGATETGLFGLILQPEDVALSGERSRRLTSVGKACMGCEVRVLTEALKEAKVGETGELLLRGDCVATRYWGDVGEEDFAGGWWHSGDLATIDEDGYVYIVDRKKDMILSGGTNIYPREIEEVISSHPGVLINAVIGIPDEEWGESVKAVVVPKEGVQISEEEIIEYCKDRLSSYKKPKSVDIIGLADMPLAGGGYKVLKKELRNRYRKMGSGKDEGIERWGVV